jgi:Na+-driven multidrug efflux pump|eukprot:COSAG06_NODE_2423_length_6901_cov_4.184358_5_plen_184_part_00
MEEPILSSGSPPTSVAPLAHTLSPLLLLSEEPDQTDRVEKVRQRGFTLALAATSLIGLVALTYETRWISALGQTQLQAYSVGHSACFYMSPLSSLWAGVTAKVGRAVGRGDDAEVSRLLKMTLVLVGATVALTWLVYLPLGRWLLVSVYKADAAILPDALAYLRLKTLGECETEQPRGAGISH